jgi:hypothetical protein
MAKCMTQTSVPHLFAGTKYGSDITIGAFAVCISSEKTGSLAIQDVAP